MRMIAAVTFLIFLRFSYGIPNGDEAEEPDPKQRKMSCFFGVFRFGKYEKHSREPSTAVTTRCGGDPIKMSTLHGDGPMDLYGAYSKLDAVLGRGAAHYMEQSEKNTWDELYICQKHLDELLFHWHSVTQKHVHRNSGKTQIHCSWPFEKHELHIHGRFIHHVMREEARVYLMATGRHIHIGAPLCYEHHRELVNVIIEYIEKTNDPDIGDGSQVCVDSDSEQCTREEMLERKFFEFTDMIGISRMTHRKEYSSYKQDTQRKKVDGVLTLQKYAIHFIAPGHESELLADLNARCSRGFASEAEATVDGAMDMISYEFLMAATRRQRDYVLSLVAGKYPYHVIARFIPSLSHSKYHRAELAALSGNLHPAPVVRTLDRFDHDGVNYFIAYITSPLVMASLPFGSRKVTLSTGEVVEIPNTIRMMGHSEIVHNFGDYMRAQNLENNLLSESSLHRILRGIPATQRHAMTCVDEYKAKAFYAFEDLLVMIDRMKELTVIDKAKHGRLRYSVLEVQLYLKSDFPLHLKNISRIADHCLFYALSDPTEPDFRNEEEHDHSHQCPRCNHMARTMRELEELMKDAVDNSDPNNNKELREMKFRVTSHIEVIWALKHHEMRSVWTDNERDRIVNNLQPGEGLYTADFAQKWENMYFREEQKQYYGKSGHSMHFTHLLTKVGNEFVSHTFIHLLDIETQDSAVVVSILEHVLHESKKMGVHSFHIRSDNAGQYHSAETLGSIQWLAERTQTSILSWSFSERQHGKSICDRKSGTAKTKMRSEVNKGKNVASLREMYEALTAPPLMRGVSVHLARPKEPFNSPDVAKLPQISNYGHFEFNSTTIRVWKYRNIGEGRIVPNMPATEVELRMIAEEGYVANATLADSERFLVENKAKAHFWYNDYERKDGDEPEDRDYVSASDEPSGVPSRNPRDTLHHCWCGAAFIRWKNLQNHLEWGTHRVIPEKIDIVDFGIGTFKKSLEDIANLSPLLPLKEVADSIIDSSIPVPEEGFALKKKRRGGKLPAEARKFVVEYYKGMMHKGERPEADEALRLLTADDNIPPESRLTYEQIKSLFSRLSKQIPRSRSRRHSKRMADEEDDEGEWEEDWDMAKEKEDIEQLYLNHILSNRDAYFDMSL